MTDAGGNGTAQTSAPTPPAAPLAPLAAILEIAADAIITANAAQDIVHFNRGAEHIFGWHATEVIGRPLDVLIPERFRIAHRRHVEAFGMSPVASRPMGERREIYGLRKDGREFPAEASIAKIGDPATGTRLYTVLLRDISARKRAESHAALLAEAGARLAASLAVDETLDAAVRLAVPALARACILELDGDAERVVRAYPGGARLPDGIHDEGGESSAASQLIVPLLGAAGTTGALTLLRDPGDPPFDETDREVAEELGRRAAVAIANARLYRMAQDATRARNEILGIVSHDLRTPLSAISMCARVLSERPPGDSGTRAELARTITESADWMQRLIQDLLDVSSIEAGRLAIVPAPVAANGVAERAASLHAAVAASRGVTVVTSYDPAAGDVLGDAERLVQALSNILDNAVAFSPAGQTVQLTTQSRDGEIVLGVHDRGPGIPPEEITRIFEQRWRGTRQARRRGAGLGLAIASGIVRAHGGRIWAESVPGEGSSFYIALPALTSA